ncbi:MAG: tRNA (N6-isopentenyl adenosine(37)-C2)-methylthiotransferase MiaB [Clostridia bacterium]|nr:tRNA (N6-isopentenyl adenosine(37)-C2)-methylthiotransferase MiaB [Clostridia bacterium]
MSTKTQTVSLEEIEKQNGYMAAVRAGNMAFERELGFKPPVFVLTLGCQQNESDSEKLAGMAEKMGYAVTDKPEDAYLIIVNTCAIREHAEKRALSLVGQYKHIKAKRPELIIAMCGCMVVQEHRAESIKRSYPYVDLLFGTSDIHRFPEFLCEKFKRGRRVLRPCEPEQVVAEDMPVRRESTYRAWVSAMYGCNNFCSYCIVPYVRGRERSRKKEEIVREVSGLVAQGYRDITLLGQNVNSYGKDMGADYDFADLLAELDTIEGDHWLHFMTSHPKDATRKLIDVMAAGTHIAHHFHLPMQSGSDSVLKAMNRRYGFDKYIGIVDYIREKMPDATITSDIIVGFPGETEEDFEATLSALRRARFDMIFSFIYSPRKGTPAAEMEQIPDTVKSERFERLLAVQNEISLASNKLFEGKTLRVLCDGESKNNPEVINGRTEGGKIVFFDGDEGLKGQFLNIEIERGDTFALYGKIKNN